jgi:hypothetical protein
MWSEKMVMLLLLARGGIHDIAHPLCGDDANSRPIIVQETHRAFLLTCSLLDIM